ncbi:MAG: DUF1573 domain-containing protein [Bacteroidales bacterium]|nr:DUF1573 domain-containing protein [Bacteroidales bacterium]
MVLGLALFNLICCGGNPEEKESKKGARIEFEKTNHDYGELDFGSEGICEFKYTNTGKEPLVLTNVKSSCGCTIPEWPKEPLRKDESASIKVRYDTHRVGTFTKSITVYSNASNSPKRIFIKGRVKPAE